MLKFYNIGIIIMFVIFMLEMSRKTPQLLVDDNEISQFQSLPKKYVILSSSVNLRYLFLLPITVASWKKLGVQAIVVLIVNNMEPTSLPKIRSTIKLLREMNVIIQFYKSRKLSPSSLSQIIRLFGPVLPAFKKTLSNDSIIIVSDADLAVFNLSNHIPDVLNGKTLHLYNSNCCDPIYIPPKRGKYTVKQFALGTIGSTVKTMIEIMEYKKTIQDIGNIEDYIIDEFGEEFFHPKDNYLNNIGSQEWYADQSLFSYKFDRWQKRQTKKDNISKHETPPHRIDRAKWPTPIEFSRLNIRDYDDCHQPIAPFTTENWEKYKPFLNIVFGTNVKFLQRLYEYRRVFCY